MNESKRKKREAHRAKHLRKDSTWLSLSKMVGKPVVDLEGFISQQFATDVPVFNICNVVLKDGTRISVEGEHDIAYLPYDDRKKGLRENDYNALIDPGDLLDEEDD